MGKKLKLYAVLMAYGAVLGITVAEIWRRKVHHDSYLNYLPPPSEREASPADNARSDGRMRGAANRLWSPVTASANEHLTRLRRVRTGAPRPTAGASVQTEEEPPASAPTTGGLVR
jgi:hypothetical protein